ncbi:GNAT family N-acetyltransferase [Candidatus Micrarchaeota archaeon]|nr:GNAT family N-acetyltransferase [Candidatus Micrarchaeota archaeon]
MLIHNTIQKSRVPASPPPLVETIEKALVVKNSFAGLDKSKVRSLLEASFGKKLGPGYFDEQIKLAILDKDYRGIAIVKEIDGMPYLDKFAVAPEYQSNGVGKRLWNELKQQCPSVIWRASENNPINGWYTLKSDGSEKSGKWIVFWCGVEATSELIQKISAREESFSAI